MTADEPSHLVPRLRFAEFVDEPPWECLPLKKLAKRITQRNTHGADLRALTNSAENGVVDQREYFDREIATNTDNYYIVETGDYVYNPRISSTAPVGPISKNQIGSGVISPLYTAFRFRGDANDFFAHYFKSSHWHGYLRQVSNSGARHDRMAITYDDLMRMPIPTPSSREQQKIADCLGSLDDLIAAEGRKLEALRQHKQGLMQQLFPQAGETQPRFRFPEFQDTQEWRVAPLGKLFETTTGGTPDRARPDYWGGEVPWVTTSIVDFNFIESTRESITSAALSNSSAKVFPKRTVLMALYGQGKTRGKVAMLGVEAATNQACAAILPSDEVDPRFVFLNLSGRYEEIRANSNSGGQENLSQALVRDLPFAYPKERAEQHLIAECLTALDDQIAAQTRKLETVKQHKRGLLQQFFPSLEGQ